MNVTAKAKWRSVPMDEQLRAKGFAEGLLGIEELTSYDLVKTKKKSVISVKEGKISKPNEKKDTLKESQSEPEGKKKKKTRQKRKPKDKKSKAKVENLQEPVEQQEVEAKEEIVELPGWEAYNIHKPILKALKELEFHEPTPIQKETLPAAINGHADILGAAETGSGKTLAFGIPIIHGILNDCERESKSSLNAENEENDEEEQLEDNAAEEYSSEEEQDMEDEEATSGCVRVVNDVVFDFDVDIEQDPEDAVKAKKKTNRKVVQGKLRALILTPTRELAIQIRNHIQAVAKYTDQINVAAIVGGMSVQKQTRLLDLAPAIVVATPGRLWDLIQEGHPHLAQVKDIRYLAIDETDRMVEKGHFEELQNLLELINEDAARKKKRQTFVFSATLSLVHEMPKHLAQKKGVKKMTSEDKLKHVMEMIGVKPRPKIVDLTRKIGTAQALTESKIHCSNNEKDFYLYYFLQQHPGRTMVFCNSIDCVRRLVNLFGLLATEPLGLHAQMHQKQRLKNLERFSENPNGFLVATDVAARGLDIPDVQHVVHYQVPRTSESYIHRSGRTARANKEGVSVMLIDAGETQSYRKMCKTLNRDEDLTLFPVDGNVLSAVKVRVQTARTLDKLLLDVRKEDVEKTWLKKAAEEAELEISDSESDDDDGISKKQVKADTQAKIKGVRAQLNTLLATPIHTQSFGGKYPTMSGRLQLPTEFLVSSENTKSALNALSKSKDEIKSLLRGKKRPAATSSRPMKKFKKRRTNKSKN